MTSLSAVEDEIIRHPTYREGAEAAIQGEHVGSNPYIPDTMSGYAWAEGYRDIERARAAQRASGRQSMAGRFGWVRQC